MALKIVPINLAKANALVAPLHRHNGVLRGGCYFCIGLADTDSYHEKYTENVVLQTEDGCGIVGAVIVGPVAARLLTKPWAAEIRRLVTDGTPNACSILYGAAWKAAKALGFEGLITYTLTTEPGTSLRASNWRLDDDDVPVRHWKSRSPEYAHLPWSKRPTTQNSPALPRLRWFIGRRIPSQSSIAYPDDPSESVELRKIHAKVVDESLSTTYEFLDETQASVPIAPEEGNRCGPGVAQAHPFTKREGTVELGRAALPSV